ncbi:Hypothetical predicted protein [Olea europaea subsp. europaea]|uniref:Uncharacterized protein n=1 Tax=Olea europaea subsp. europaea TaxID=158383 RepID=A0A8S0Q3S3_OLEEU|nr:Hypothetical predicted protein [Olea europaea subsp. europaea]
MAHRLEHEDNIFNHLPQLSSRCCHNSSVDSTDAVASDVGRMASSRSVVAPPTAYTHFRCVSRQRKARFVQWWVTDMICSDAHFSIFIRISIFTHPFRI